MSSKKTYDRSSKRIALVIWSAVSAMLLGAMLLPLYWFWDRIASRPTVLVLILGLLALALFTWWKLVFAAGRRIRGLSEQ